MNLGQYGKDATEKGISCYKWYDTTLKSLQSAVRSIPPQEPGKPKTPERADYENNLMLIQRMKAFDTATQGTGEQDREKACFDLIASLNSLPKKGKTQVLKAALAEGKKSGGPLTHLGPPWMLIGGIAVGTIVVGAIVFKLRG